MLSMVLKIKREEAFLGYQEQFSHLVRNIYNNQDKITPEFKKDALDRCPLLDVMAWDSAIIAAKMRKSQHQTSLNKRKEKLDTYKEELSTLNKKDTYKYFNLDRKIKYLSKSIDKNADTTFGGKALLRAVTYNRNMYNKTKDDKYLLAYKDKKKEFNDKRNMPFVTVGKACEGGNRKFDFDFRNNLITFKPCKGVKYVLKIFSGKKQHKTLLALQEMIDKNEIAITVSLKANSITLTYDELKLSGYEFNAKECKKEQLLTEDKNQKKIIWRKHKTEQDERMIQDKIPTRAVGIDMNPDNIGVCIMDEKEIIYKADYSLEKIIEQVEDNDTDSIKNSLGNIYTGISNTCTHYKVSKFGIEDLNFKQQHNKSKAFNRKTQNLWCRDFQVKLIKKHCNTKGFQLCELNPAYSSFVGNLSFDFYDPISAAAEMARRTLIFTKILSEEWYPLKSLRLDNYRAYVPDLEKLTLSELYQKIVSLKMGYRRVDLPPHKLETTLFDLYSY
jgi:IS605 OrfB family transposase